MSDVRADKIRGFRLHAMIAMAGLMVAIAANVLVSPGYPWWLWLACAWALPLAFHWAKARELFGTGK
ncbi:MAG: hypothetical protein GC202_05875 [Alphaproteobacteria bacterium]|nr:hypothetical protein [Alphaproteobacteria bacterium]